MNLCLPTWPPWTPIPDSSFAVDPCSPSHLVFLVCLYINLRSNEDTLVAQDLTETRYVPFFFNVSLVVDVRRPKNDNVMKQFSSHEVIWLVPMKKIATSTE